MSKRGGLKAAATGFPSGPKPAGLRSRAVGFPVAAPTNKGGTAALANTAGNRPAFISTHRLSQAAVTYAHCLCAPHRVELSAIPGVPVGGQRTLPFRSFCRGSFTVNTTGSGWVAFSPTAGWDAAAIGANAPVLTSDVAGSSAAITAEAAFAMTSIISSTGTSYDGYVRFVAACITVTYRGQLSVVEGSYMGVTVPGGTLEGIDETAMLSFASVHRVPVVYGETYCQLQQPPLLGDATKGIYPAVEHAWLPTALRTGDQTLQSAILVRAAPGDEFNFEVTAIYEWLPNFGFAGATSGMPALNAMLRHSVADPNGMAAVDAARQYMPMNGAMNGTDLGLGQKLVRAAEDVLAEGVKGVGDTARAVTRYVAAREAAKAVAWRYGERAVQASVARNLLAEAALTAALVHVKQPAPTGGAAGEPAPATPNRAEDLTDAEWELVRAQRSARDPANFDRRTPGRTTNP